MAIDSSLIVPAVAFVAAMVNGGLGYGFSSITVPVALLFHASRVLNPALVLVELALNVEALVLNRRALKGVFRSVRPMLAGAVGGVVAGSLALAALNPELLKLVTYLVLLPLIVLQSTGKRWPVRTESWAGVPLGAGVGALYAATTISGPPLALLFNNQGMTRDEFRAALSLFRVVESTLTAIVYLYLGLFTREAVSLSLSLAPVVVAGMVLGYVLLRNVNAESFRRICLSADAVLVSFALARLSVTLQLADSAVAYSALGVVVLSVGAVALKGERKSVAVSDERAPRASTAVPLDFPVALRLHGRKVLVVGAGVVAERRIQQLVEVGAEVHVVAPQASEAVRALAARGEVRWSERAFDAADCRDVLIAFGATNDREVNRAVYEAAHAAGHLANACDDPEYCDFFVPSIGRRGPVTVAVSTAGLAPNLGAHLRDKALAAVTPGDARLAKLIGRLRRILPGGPPRTLALQQLVKGGAAELIDQKDRQGLRTLLREVAQPEALKQERRPSSQQPGVVHLVGAGPGAPGLITVRGAELIRRAHTIVYDRLVHPRLIELASSRARLIYAGKEGGGAQTTQEEINRILIAQARLGREVVRLKGGDPFVFGRGGEEALALAEAGIPFEITPGISSGVAGPALAAIPVTHRGVARSVTFATGHTAKEAPDYARLAAAETLVMFMAGQRLEVTASELIAAGRSASTPAAVIESASWENERIVEGTLETIAGLAREARIGSPALLVIGEVVALRAELLATYRAVAGREEPLHRAGGMP